MLDDLPLVLYWLDNSAEKAGFCWTKWMNRYKANEGTDLEIYTRHSILEYNICRRPYAIDYARTDGKPVREKVECTFFGCTCRDVNQAPGVYCADYKVRFLCPCKRTLGDHEHHSDDIFLCDALTSKTISCPANKIIRISSAYYGNVWFSRCGLGSMISSCRQESSLTLQRVSMLCDRKRTCQVTQKPDDIEDRLCKNTKKVLHVEYSCETIARAPGNYSGAAGEVYVDPTCKYKCTFLMSNRAICLPVCPIYYGFACAPGSVIRWSMKRDKYAQHCLCRQPACVQPAQTCKVNNKIYQVGATYRLGCEEECKCESTNNVLCVPLCSKVTECPVGYFGKEIRETHGMDMTAPSGLEPDACHFSSLRGEDGGEAKVKTLIEKLAKIEAITKQKSEKVRGNPIMAARIRGSEKYKATVNQMRRQSSKKAGNDICFIKQCKKCEYMKYLSSVYMETLVSSNSAGNTLVSSNSARNTLVLSNSARNTFVSSNSARNVST
eukprot:gene7446-8268_t